MAKTTDLNDIANALREADDFAILTHQYPDGDTVGSAFALCRALRKLGKRAGVVVNGKLDKKFDYLLNNYEDQDFKYKTVVTVDIAAPQLLGELREEFEGRIDISIDHHTSNSIEAKLSYVDPKAANAENVLELIRLLKAEFDKDMANAIYTGICTDTGCFKFSNVNSATMRAAADMMDIGCDSTEINRVMFDLKSMARIRMEKAVLDSLTLHAGGMIAVVNTTIEMEHETGVGDTDMDGIASIPRQIEGVYIGITIKEKDAGRYRISIRTLAPCDASRIAEEFGGGGHHAAAGCTMTGGLYDVKTRIVEAAKAELERAGVK